MPVPVHPPPTALSHASAPQRLVAAGPVWSDTTDQQPGVAAGFAYLPVTIHGKGALLMVDLNKDEDLGLSVAALKRLGVTPPNDTATIWDSVQIGTDVHRHIPLRQLRLWNWTHKGPPLNFFADMPGMAPATAHLLAQRPVVGFLGTHFLTTHYDLLYRLTGFPGTSQVQLYAFPEHPAHPTGTSGTPVPGWLPRGLTTDDCARRIEVPPGNQAFTGMEMQLDGHPVTGVLEMGMYTEKMNMSAFHALGLAANDPRIQPIPTGPGNFGQTQQVAGVKLQMNHHTFWSGPVQIFPQLGVDAVLGATTPIMLWNLSTIDAKHLTIFDSVSGGYVCVSAPAAEAAK